METLPYKFYVVDDDPVICDQLSTIIEEEGLGTIIGKATNGLMAIEELTEIESDIVIIDLLMPELDGIEVVRRLKHNSFKGDFILLSQVTDKSMIQRAYKAGVEFYINKPIEKTEVVSVLNKIIENKRLKQVVSDIKKTLLTNNENESNSSNESMYLQKNPTQKVSKTHIQELAERTLNSLGILNHPGSGDIIEATKIMYALPKEDSLKILQDLKALYQEISKKYQLKNPNLSYSEKAIERRIRRAIGYAFVNIAALGIEDYHHPKFERFSYNFFDFHELRKEMQKLSQGNKITPKVKVKKFLEGLYHDILSQIT